MRHAFSLVELVIVIAVLAVVAAIAAPRLASANIGPRLQAVKSRMHAEALAAGEAARATGTSRSIVIDPDTDRLFVYEGGSGAVGQPISIIDFAASPYSADITGWSETKGGFVSIDGYGIFDKGIKVNVAVGGLSQNMTLELPSLESDSSTISAEGGSR